MEEKIREVIGKLRGCPLSDNQVDYVEKELLLESELGWEVEVTKAIKQLELLISSHPIIDPYKQDEEETAKMNEWDKDFDRQCHDLIDRAQRWYEEYKAAYIKRKPKMRNYLSFEYWARANDMEREILTQGEAEIIKKEFILRLGSNLRIVELYTNTIIDYAGLDCSFEEGLFHIYAGGLAGFFIEDVIPILYPLGKVIENGLLLKYYKESRGKKLSRDHTIENYKNFIRIWNPGMRGYDEIGLKDLTRTVGGYKFCIRESIDINGLVDLGLAASIDDYPEAYGDKNNV